MADNAPAHPSATWLPVIGKALAYLCLQDAKNKDTKKFDTVLKQVAFLEGLGLSLKDAAETAGSSLHSVQVMLSREAKGKKDGSKK